jgi:non-canonical purine NTP pyrophosphatase (RdgB/HAM1 family)
VDADLSLPPFVVVTGNPGKLREVERLLGYRPDHAGLDLPEIQSLDLVEVLRAKADEAWRRLERPLVVDETGLALAALEGFPGPLVKWMLTAVGAAGISRVAHRLGDPRATACCALLYRDAGREVVARAEVPGRLAAAPRGSDGFGWDPIFVPDGQDKTYAEMDAAEKDRCGHRGSAWRDLWTKLRTDPAPGV